MADAGANTNAFDAKDEGVLDNVVMTPNDGLVLQVANGGTMRAYGTGTMRIMAHLPEEQRRAHLFDKLKSGSLVAVGKLAQLGHVVSYRKEGVTVTREDTGEVVLQGPYDKDVDSITSIWMRPRKPTTQHARTRGCLSEQLTRRHSPYGRMARRSP